MTQPVSERNSTPQTPPDWGGLLGSPFTILDACSVENALNTAAAGVSGGSEIRKAAMPVLSAAFAEGRATIAAEIRSRPAEAHRAIHDYAWLVDQVIFLTLDFVLRWLHPNPNPTASERISALAVGGYGRAELAPFSDVDLLFLTPYKQTPWGESVIESLLYCLWDLRLKVGHSVRTIEDCIRLSRSDVTIRTSLLERRFLWGDRALSDRLSDRLWSDVFENSGPEFVELKLNERAERHKRQGSTRYLLEPNVKEGKGGLRDLQTLFWIAKYLNRAERPGDLVKMGVFTPQEYRVFADSADFLWMTRVHLHLLSKRAIEQLTFDTQVEIAATLGYSATQGQRSVERFMQDYFTNAKHVGDLTRIFLAAIEAQQIKTRPSLGRAIRGVFSNRRETAPEGYRLRNGRLDLIDTNSLLQRPVEILKLFQEELSTGIPIHPDALRIVAANLDLINDRMRADPEANRIFLSLLLSHANPEKALRLMNEVGVLGAFIPEFGRIVSMMQFNMYHRYTVDEHIIQTISTLSKIERGELSEALPISTEIIAKGVNRRVVYVALLLHDIGKGSGQDHSTVGAEVAETLCPRFGLDDEETEQVIWLVRNHLLMSDTAQKRDLSEPRTVRDFAKSVQSATRLKLLTVLTVCDIIGVGPGIWNNWKATLIRGLYHDTLEYLTGGSQALSRPEREASAKAALIAALTDWSPERIAVETARHYPPYWIGFDTRTHAIFANLVQSLPEGEPAMNFEMDFDRDATQACFAMADHPGIFARIAGALALAGANVVDARTYTSTDGIATAAFWIQDLEGKPYDESRLDRLRNSVAQSLAGGISTRDALRERDKIKRRERDFIVPTRIRFDNLGSDIYTIIEVETRDRPGLLYDLARTLTANNISIASAIIATYGKQAVDVFYIKDLFGLKLHAESRRRALETRLRAAISTIDGENR